MARVLVVDDEAEVLDALEGLLTAGGYQVARALSCEEALGMIEAELPDLILSDLNMPCANGFDFLQMLRERNLTEHVPVIFVTAMCRPEDREACVRAGASGYVEKPVDPVRLLGSVEACLPAA